jgi:hypothetical protein
LQILLALTLVLSIGLRGLRPPKTAETTPPPEPPPPQPPPQPQPLPPQPSTAAAAAASAAAAADLTGTKDFKVAMICDSSISDGGWGAACYNAMVDACKRSGWSYEVTDSIDQSAYYESIAARTAIWATT